MWRLNSKLLNNQWGKERNQKKIRKNYLGTNKSGNISKLLDVAKAVLKGNS